MTRRVLIFAMLLLCIAVTLAACAQILGIEDLPPLPGRDGGPGDATPSDRPALVSLSVSGIAPAITLLPGVDEYTVDLPLLQESVTVTATVNELVTGLSIAGQPATSGVPSAPISLALGDNPIEIVMLDGGNMKIVYHVILRRAERLVQYAYGKTSNTDIADGVGEGRASVAVSGDTLAIGVPGEDSATQGVNGNQNDNSLESSGAVYIFRRAGNSWQQEAYIKASNGQERDLFGWSVALSGDTLAVGAPWRDSVDPADPNLEDLENTGAVYMFRRVGRFWQQEAYLTVAASIDYDNFGRTVALAGDTLAVAVPYEKSAARGIGGNPLEGSAYNSGAVYIFHRTGDAWSQEAYIKASNTDSQDYFGWSIALSGDTLAVGAPEEASAGSDQNDNSLENSGAVYLFRRTGMFWQQEAYIKSSNPTSDEWFGSSVALSGDNLAVGQGIDIDDNDPMGGLPRAVYVFHRDGKIWQEEAYIQAPDAEDGFGYSLALSGDMLAVGAHGEDSAAQGIDGDQADNSAQNSGAVYWFRRSATDWQQEAYVKASNTGSEDNFGWSIALADDTLAIVAPNEDSNAVGIGGNQADDSAGHSGAFYVFH